MTQTELRARAPRDATHYTESSIFKSHPYYFKIHGNDAYIWELMKRWRKTIRNFNEYSNLKPL